jgi:hypothetical protein
VNVAELLRPTLVIDVRAAILYTAREYVMGCATVADALREAHRTVEPEAFDMLAEILGIVDQRKLPTEYRRALVKAIVVETRQMAEAAADDEDHPEYAGIAGKRLQDALDRNSDHIAACDECDGRGCDDCHGGLVTTDVTALAVRLRDEALVACVQREAKTTNTSNEEAA